MPWLEKDIFARLPKEVLEEFETHVLNLCLALLGFWYERCIGEQEGIVGSWICDCVCI